MIKPELILASGSPQRRRLLREWGYPFDVAIPDASAECGACSETGPAELVAEFAYRKARSVVDQVRQGILVACDTVAECQGQILGKPAHLEDARAMLTLLSGRRHRVLSGLCVWNLPSRQPSIRLAVTTLRMKRLSDQELEDYLESHQWEGKAGALGYQDRTGWVEIIEGSESNVIGMPMELLAEMLAESPGNTMPGRPA